MQPKKQHLEVGLTDFQAILSPRVGVLGVKRKVRVSSSLWRPAEVEEGSVGFSCLSAGTPPSTSSSSTLTYFMFLHSGVHPVQWGSRKRLKIMIFLQKSWKEITFPHNEGHISKCYDFILMVLWLSLVKITVLFSSVLVINLQLYFHNISAFSFL